MRRLFHLTALLAPLALCACTSAAPTVEIVEASPEKLSTSDDESDDLTMVVRYTDGDGDLGQGVAKIYDCRADGLVTELAIPRIANEEAVKKGVPIAGELTLVVADIGAIEPAAEASAECADLGVAGPADGAQAFCVVLADAAGNESAGACTGPILIEP